jgi:hypothetical protein
MDNLAPLTTYDLIDLDSSLNSIDVQLIALSSNSASSVANSLNHPLISESFSQETISTNSKINKNE